VKTITIPIAKWDKLWENFLTKMELIESQCKEECPQRSYVNNNIHRKFIYASHGLKNEIEDE